MKLIVGNREISNLVHQKFSRGSCILFKYGPGSGGDVLLKQFLFDGTEGTHSIYISTHETEQDIRERMEELGSEVDIETISLQEIRDRELEPIIKKDLFRKEGIMVTDLLEVSSNTGSRNRAHRGETDILSTISTVARKQVLTFQLVLDSIADLIDISNVRDVEKRIRILKKALKERGGYALVAAPFSFEGLTEREMTLFDGIIEVISDDSGGTWRRELTIRNIKGSPDLPEKWDVTGVQNIPVAKSLD